ncbi:hypothetical protein BGX38DRAFT_1263618 [Terfezia claveryi]|nr:hypothetical protein BGX38DRAFT_1263618 [Terfezia claveryi]
MVEIGLEDHDLFVGGSQFMFSHGQAVFSHGQAVAEFGPDGIHGLEDVDDFSTERYVCDQGEAETGGNGKRQEGQRARDTRHVEAVAACVKGGSRAAESRRDKEVHKGDAPMWREARSCIGYTRCWIGIQREGGESALYIQASFRAGQGHRKE